jgi:hypothetical protein
MCYRKSPGWLKNVVLLSNLHFNISGAAHTVVVAQNLQVKHNAPDQHVPVCQRRYAVGYLWYSPPSCQNLITLHITDVSEALTASITRTRPDDRQETNLKWCSISIRPHSTTLQEIVTVMFVAVSTWDRTKFGVRGERGSTFLRKDSNWSWLRSPTLWIRVACRLLPTFRTRYVPQKIC